MNQHEPGAKFDQGKVRVALMMRGFAKALWAVAEVSTHGAEKYSPGGWQYVIDGDARYDDAQMRHKLLEWMGESNDKDSCLKHAAQAAWNALARLELMLRDESLQNDQHGVFGKEDVDKKSSFGNSGGISEPKKDKASDKPDCGSADCVACRTYRVSNGKVADKSQRPSVWPSKEAAGFRRDPIYGMPHEPCDVPDYDV